MTARSSKARLGGMRLRNCGVIVIATMLLLVGCGPAPPPPPALLFEGLPVSGSNVTATRACFNRCIDFGGSVRCRRDAVSLGGAGPYNAAVDLRGGDGREGFDHLTLWHDRDQYAVYGVSEMLTRRGWRSCYTSIDGGQSGDQMIFSRPGALVSITMDLSYWMKRRVRVFPAWSRARPTCAKSAPAASPP
jgi:hypothetical protein